MTDILQATQKQINDAAATASTDTPIPDIIPGGKISLTGPTPAAGSAVGRMEPPLPDASHSVELPPIPSQKTGSSLDLTSKTEPIQSPPLPIESPDVPASSGTWSPEKAKREKEDDFVAPIANIPQYDRKASSSAAFNNIPLPMNSKMKLPDLPIPSPIAPSAGSSTSVYIPPPPNIAIGLQTSTVVPPPKKSKGKGMVIAIILFLAAAIPLGVLFVSNQQNVADVRTQAIGDLRYLCTPDACAVGGCNQPCTANLAGTNISWDGNAYTIPSNGYAIKNKCYGVESGATNSACACPGANITDPTGSGDTCDLPDIERYFLRGPGTIGWDETNYCGTQQVDITVGQGNSSFFHTKEDTRPEICSAAPTPTPTPVPQCYDGSLFKVYAADGVTEISASLINGLTTLSPGDIVYLATTRVSGADHARFRLQGYGDWINNTETTETEFRVQITIPVNFSGTNGAFEADICADATDTNCN